MFVQSLAYLLFYHLQLSLILLHLGDNGSNLTDSEKLDHIISSNDLAFNQISSINDPEFSKSVSEELLAHLKMNTEDEALSLIQKAVEYVRGMSLAFQFLSEINLKLLKAQR